MEAVVHDIERELRVLATEHMLELEIHGRTKTVLSFVKKIHRKRRTGDPYTDPTRQITDLAGVRCVFLSRSDRDRFVRVVVERWPGATVEFKAPAVDKLGYRGVHVTVRADSADGSQWCEVQMRTIGEDAWDKLSHALLYKPDLELPENVARNLYLLQALAELIDGEAERGKAAMTGNPRYPAARLLAIAEREFTPRTGQDFDRDLSLDILQPISATISDIDAYASELHDFSEAHDVRLRQVLAAHADDTFNFILSQPEAVVLFYELERDEYRLRDLWNSHFDPDLLDPVIDAWPQAI